MLIIAAVVATGGCGSNPVAVVGGVKITEAEFRERMVKTYGRTVLQEMINEELLRQAAQDAQITVTEEELNEEIATFKQERFPNEEAFNQWMAGVDLSQQELRDLVRMAVITRKLALRDVEVTDEKLKQFFEQNKSRYDRPATVAMSEIVVDSRDTAEQVLQQLRAGEASFEDLARRYSLDTHSRNRGGERPEVAIERIPIEPIREAARTLPVGEVSDPIDTDGQYYIIKVRDRQPAREASWPEDRERVLDDYRGFQAKPREEIIREQIKQTKVQVLDPRFTELNEDYTPVPTEVPQFGAEEQQAPTAAPPEQPAAPANSTTE
ncbi:MAG: peptidyl-prolyl cis-trans isomerase [Armatimonadota bacterium]|nr:peptidyl-prolyl cis-trans isomerase [Armatimonadota bacterium]